jgi:hypothetical protein
MKDLIDYSRQTESGPIGAIFPSSSLSYCLYILLCNTICLSYPTCLGPKCFVAVVVHEERKGYSPCFPQTSSLVVYNLL